MFRNIHTIKAFSLFVILIVLPVLSIAGQARKPLPPLRISIAPVQAGITPDQIKPGDNVEFRITAVSAIEVREMRVDVELTGGAKLVSGDTSWRGAATKNEGKSIILTVQAPENGQGGIRARVNLPPSGNARFSAQAQYVLGHEIKSKPEEEHPVKKDSKGRNVIEYR